MLRRISRLPLHVLLLSMTLFSLTILLLPSSHAFAAPKPVLTLNRQQGPLGVTLTLKGEKFPPGSAGLSYIDSQNMPGAFTPPGDSNVQVQNDGTFSTSHLIMPASGPVGPWKIVVTDSSGRLWSISYLVLGAPGQQTAGAPSLTVNPTSAAGGDVIAFSGNNWLPAGTTVKLALLAGSATSSLLATPLVSNANGMITGTFALPANLGASLATVSATDVATGALSAQVQMLITAASPTPSTSPTPSLSPTATNAPSPTPTATATPIASTTSGSDTSSGPPSSVDRVVWGSILLIVGGMLGVAAVMLLLFLLPAEDRRRDIRHGRYY